MWDAGSGRLSTWRAIIARTAWRWLVLIPLTGLTTQQLIREEFLSPEEQENYRIHRFFKYLPDWPLEWWIILVLLVGIFLILEGAYLEQRDLRLRLRDAGLERYVVKETCRRRISGTSTTPMTVCHVDFKPSSKSTRVIVTDVAAGRSAPGEVRFLLLRDGKSLANTTKDHSFAVLVDGWNKMVQRSFEIVEPMTRKNVRYSLAFCSDDKFGVAYLNSNGNKETGYTVLQVFEERED